MSAAWIEGGGKKCQRWVLCWAKATFPRGEVQAQNLAVEDVRVLGFWTLRIASLTTGFSVVVFPKQWLILIVLSQESFLLLLFHCQVQHDNSCRLCISAATLVDPGRDLCVTIWYNEQQGVCMCIKVWTELAQFSTIVYENSLLQLWEEGENESLGYLATDDDLDDISQRS